MSTGMLEEPFASNRSIEEETVPGNPKPLFFRLKEEPLTFNLNFAFEKKWDEELIQRVSRWLLNHQYYQELIFYDEENDYPEKVFYALFVDSPSIFHNGLREGYISLKVRCDSPYVYTPYETDKVYNWTYSDKSLSLTDFSNGEHTNTEINNNNLELISEKVKWTDFSSEITWASIT